jgi:hypothetical protein
MADEEGATRRRGSARWAVVALCGVQFVDVLGVTAAITAIPAIIPGTVRAAGSRPAAGHGVRGVLRRAVGPRLPAGRQVWASPRASRGPCLVHRGRVCGGDCAGDRAATGRNCSGGVGGRAQCAMRAPAAAVRRCGAEGSARSAGRLECYRCGGRRAGLCPWGCPHRCLWLASHLCDLRPHRCLPPRRGVPLRPQRCRSGPGSASRPTRGGTAGRRRHGPHRGRVPCRATQPPPRRPWAAWR